MKIVRSMAHLLLRGGVIIGVIWVEENFRGKNVRTIGDAEFVQIARLSRGSSLKVRPV
jgi:hypothetical protein